MSDERRVWIAQLKCPSNHCIFAVAGEYNTAAEAEALRDQVCSQFVRLVADLKIDPGCAICGALLNRFHVDLGRTLFRTMAEAQKPLQDAMVAQAISR